MFHSKIQYSHTTYRQKFGKPSPSLATKFQAKSRQINHRHSVNFSIFNAHQNANTQFRVHRKVFAVIIIKTDNRNGR